MMIILNFFFFTNYNKKYILNVIFIFRQINFGNLNKYRDLFVCYFPINSKELSLLLLLLFLLVTL
jgi:hypothetical protein